MHLTSPLKWIVVLCEFFSVRILETSNSITRSSATVFDICLAIVMWHFLLKLNSLGWILLYCRVYLFDTNWFFRSAFTHNHHVSEIRSRQVIGCRLFCRMVDCAKITRHLQNIKMKNRFTVRSCEFIFERDESKFTLLRSVRSSHRLALNPELFTQLDRLLKTH